MRLKVVPNEKPRGCCLSSHNWKPPVSELTEVLPESGWLQKPVDALQKPVSGVS